MADTETGREQDATLGPEPPDNEDATGARLGAGPPEISTQREAWLGRLRDRLRGRLFGSSSVVAAPATFEEFKVPASGTPIPAKIGRYEVIGRIGSGGMGVIYAALDRDLGRKVAVKILNPADALREEQARARLVREAQALARLSHPTVVHVYEVGSFEEQVFMAMEFVEGTTLRRWQAQAERSWRSVLGAYVAAGEGLAAAHRVGIVHRDFKPDNVLVRNDGEVRVIDFGLARTDKEGGQGPALTADLEAQSPEAPMTRTGTLMGTPAYMAPEQFRGAPADARTDQFSFCVALFEALFGYRPFLGATVFALAQNVMAGRAEPPPRYTDVPEAVSRVLLRGLEVDPEARYPTMEALLAELPSESPRGLRWVATGVLALGTVGAVSAWWWNTTRDADRDAAEVRIKSEFDTTRSETAQGRLRTVQQRGQVQRWNTLVLGAASQIVTRDPTRALGMLKALDEDGEDWYPAARLVASAAVERDVLARSLIVEGTEATAIRVARDGLAVVYAAKDRSSVWMHWTDGGERRELTGLSGAVAALDTSSTASVIVAGDAGGNGAAWVDGQLHRLPRHGAAVTAVAVDGDGTWLASGDATGRIHLGPVPPVMPMQEARSRAAIVALAFSADGGMLASADRTGLIRVFRTARSVRDTAVLREFSHRASVGVRSLHFAQSGAFLDCLGVDGRLWRIRTDDWTSQMVDGFEAVSQLARSPSSSTWAVVHRVRGLQVADDFSAPARAVGQEHQITDLDVSADGRFVATASGKVVRLWRLAEPPGHRVDVHDAAVVDLAYSAATQRLAAGASSGAVRVWALPDLGELELGSLLGGVRVLSFSPLGGRLAAVGGSAGMTVWTLDGTTEPRTLSPASSLAGPLRWSTDGSVLAAQLCDSPRRCALVVHDLDRQERPLSTTLGVPFRSIDLSSDGEQAVAVRAGQYDVVSLFGVRDGSRRRPPWTGDEAPRRFVAHAFTDDGTAIRLAGRDGDVLSLWHWDLVDDVVVELDRRPVNNVITDVSTRVVLVRTSEGDEIWPVLEPLPQPIARLPDSIERFELSASGDELLALGEGVLTVLHLATGISRELGTGQGPFAWLGGAGRARTESRSWVRIVPDPTPAHPQSFMAWLEGLTDVDAGEVLVPTANLGAE